MNALAQAMISDRRAIWRYTRSEFNLQPQEQYGALTAATLEPDEASAGVASAFSARSEPDWMQPSIGRLAHLLTLPEGWDGHGGRAVSPATANFTIQFLSHTLGSTTPAPQIVPLSYGGLQLEWHEKGIDLEVEIIAPNHVYVTFEDKITGAEFEKEYKTDFRDLATPIDELTSR